jgi:CCR4-NOT transcription complex subunit 6
MPPRPRDRVEYEDSPASEVLSVVSYNILCDRYATASQYGYTPSADLAWSHRKMVILDELREYDADIVCLQEVDRENYDDFSQNDLKANDYRGIFWPKSRAKTMADKEAKLVDGCATFYKASKYILLDKMLIDFANTAINRPDMKGEHDTFNRVMPRDHIAVAIFLENRMTGSRMIVVNAHIFWDPVFADVKLVQVAILMEQISKQADKWSKLAPCKEKLASRKSQANGEADVECSEEPTAEPGSSLEYGSGPEIPLIMCGDFNSDSTTGVYELITTGSVPGDHCDMSNRSYGNFTRDGMAHPFKLRSAYNTQEELSFTNYTPNFSGVIDYIWYSHPSLQVRELLGNVDDEYLRRVPGFPNHHFPSDHIALKADFGVKQSKAVETNGTQRQWERSNI